MLSYALHEKSLAYASGRPNEHQRRNARADYFLKRLKSFLPTEEHERTMGSRSQGRRDCAFTLTTSVFSKKEERSRKRKQRETRHRDHPRTEATRTHTRVSGRKGRRRRKNSAEPGRRALHREGQRPEGRHRQTRNCDKPKSG